jgi:methyl-accepting chemotaxis protein
MLLLACVAVLAVGVSAYRAVAAWAQESVRERLSDLAESQAGAIERRWAQVRSELSVQARSAYTVSAIDEIGKWMELGAYDLRSILDHYQGGGSLSAEQRVEQSGREHKHGYSWRHIPIHETYRAAVRQFGYADMYLVSARGRVVYSVGKGPEFGRLVSEPDLDASGFGQVVAAAQGLPPGKQAVVDFAPYDPVGGESRAFLAQRFAGGEDGGDSVSGTLVIALDTRIIDAVLSASASGMREVGAYLVGIDGFMRSNPALRLAGSAPRETLDASRLKSAGGVITTMTSRDGAPLLATGRAVKVGDWTWQLWLTEPQRTAFAVVDTIRQAMIVAALVALGPLLVFALFLGLSVARPIRGLSQALAGVATGRTDLHIPGAQRKDEIGAIAASVLRIRENLIREETDRLADREERELDARRQRTALLGDLAADLERSILSVTGAVSASAEELSVTATELSNGALQTQANAGTVHDSTSRAIASIRSIEGAAQDLRTAIDRLDSDVQSSDRSARSARDYADEMGAVVDQLASGAARVSDVIGMISDIAAQTNLLALNATIEAARAGEAGRGFAVVASEVKGLSGQTARAIEDISRQIAGMNQATTATVEAIAGIRGMIGGLSDTVRRTAETMRHQHGATHAIVTEVGTATAAFSRIGEATSLVSSASQQTSDAAGALLRASSELTGLAHGLKTRVDEFITQVRAA